jgi:hypothetical protein
MIQIGVNADSFGAAATPTRVSRIRKVRELGAEIDPSTGAQADDKGMVYFLVPEDKIAEFQALVNSF